MLHWRWSCSASPPFLRFSWPRASSHREAPITALDPKADITDLWAFRSYDINGNDTNPPSITIIMAVDPFAEPANGPNWFPFDPKILYQVHVDNDNDGLDEVTFQFRFSSQIQLPAVYTALAGFTSTSGGGAPGIPPQITDFPNPGLSLRQTYTVTMIKNGVGTQIVNNDGSPFYAVPANAGPRTMKYADLYAAGSYTSTNQDISVFSGTVDDPFFIDLGGAFDTGNFHTGPSGIPGVVNSSSQPEGTGSFEQGARQRIDQPDNANRELALYYAGTGQRPAVALRIARLEIERRHDVRTLDAYGSALYASGQLIEARRQIERALAVGTRDEALLCHAAAIGAAGTDEAAANRRPKSPEDPNLKCAACGCDLKPLDQAVNVSAIN